MVLVAQPLRDDLQKLLRVLLVAADARAERELQRLDERARRDRLPVDGPLIEPVQHLLQRPGDRPLLQLPDLLGRLAARHVRRLRQEVIDLGPVELAAVKFPDQVAAQLPETREGLQNGVDEAIIGRVGEPDYPLLAAAAAGGVIPVDSKVGPEDVEERDRSEGRPSRIGGDGRWFVRHRRLCMYAGLADMYCTVL